MKRLSHSTQVVAALVPVLVGAVPTVAQPAKSQPNAYDFYLRAGSVLQIPSTNDWPQLDNPKLRGSFKTDLERQQYWLNKNRNALAIVRQGFRFAYTFPVRRSLSEVIDFRMTFFSRMMNIAELLKIESRVCRARREYSRAMSIDLDVVRLGSDLSRGALVDMIVGFSVQDSGWIEIARNIRTLDAASAQACAKRLETLDTRAWSYNAVLQREKQQGQMLLHEIFSEPSWRRNYETKKSPHEIEATYNALMNEAIANALKPYPLRRKSFRPPDDAVNGQLFSPFYSAEQDVPTAAATGTPHERVQTINRLLATQMALHAFKTKHGAYPTTLSELVPSYLQKVPHDPFSDNQPLHYIRRGIEYSLYSVGPDAQDDKGKAIQPADAIKTTSQGDIVAGINR